METNLKEIERTAKLKQGENWEFRAFLKGYDIPIEELDTIVYELLRERIWEDSMLNNFDGFIDFED